MVAEIGSDPFSEDISMGLEERVESLKVKHQALEAAIEEENSHPYPDDLHLVALKKQKLRIKDQLATLNR